jgi:hypothetical protein
VAAWIRNGKICRHCTAKTCKDKGTETEPISFECPACEGHGCDACDDGYFQIDGCPNAFCRTVIPAIELIDLFEKGLPPVSGGALNQSASFLSAAKFFAIQNQLAKEPDSE